MNDSKTSPRKALTIRVPVELHRDARLISVERGETLNELVVKWLDAWVTRMKESR